MKCGFCGKEFEVAEAAAACAGCPLHRTCGKGKCPYCGYEAIKTPRWLSWLTRGGGTAESAGNGACTLASMRAGERGVIRGLAGADERTVRKLMAMGLVPGTELSVIRAKPGVVLRIGFGELALDRETAGRVQMSLDYS